MLKEDTASSDGLADFGRTRAPRRPFTDRYLTSLKVTSRRYEVLDPARKGLLMRVTPNGVKTFCFRYQRNLKSVPALFFTRWVTHFCAPLFFFLAGVGAFFYGTTHTSPELRLFLWSRGLWLIALEFTVVGFAWSFVFPWGFFGVIWALGCSVILLSLLVRLPNRWIAVASIAVILLHDVLDPLRPAQFGSYAWISNALHVKGVVHIGATAGFVLFPLIPLCAVMAAGYAFGALLVHADRRKWLIVLGLMLTTAFIALRATNLYGNPPLLPGGVTPGDFHIQSTIAKTLILFLDTEKYPPSLQFLLMTIGPSLLLLAWLDSRPIAGIWRSLVVFGRVPLFFCLLHLYLIHALAVGVALVTRQPYRWLLDGGFWFHDIPEGYGHDLLACMRSGRSLW